MALILAWKFNAKEAGFFSRSEFASGAKELRARNLDELRRSLANTREAVDRDPAQLRLAWVFAFDFCKEAPDKKVVETMYATVMINLVFGGRKNFRHISSFLNFLEVRAEGLQPPSPMLQLTPLTFLLAGQPQGQVIEQR
jgi:hypothetical protein